MLRARLTQLTPDLPLVWSRTLAGTSSAPALLREATDLKSAEDARKEYLDALQDRGPVSIPVRVAIRTYAQPFNQRAIQPPPYIWLQSGAEISPTAAQAWRSSFVVGYSFAPQAYNGVMGQTRVSRLVTGKVRSRTRPDLYAFVGGAVLATWGPAAAAFRKPILRRRYSTMRTSGSHGSPWARGTWKQTSAWATGSARQSSSRTTPSSAVPRMPRVCLPAGNRVPVARHRGVAVLLRCRLLQVVAVWLALTGPAWAGPGDPRVLGPPGRASLPSRTERRARPPGPLPCPRGLGTAPDRGHRVLVRRGSPGGA